MAGSKASRNAAGLRSLKAAATCVNRSQTSCAGSAPRQAAKGKNSSSNRVRVMVSSPVAGVDADVALGQVAGPESRRALAFRANGHPDFAFRGVQFRLQLGLRKRRREGDAAIQQIGRAHV